MGLFACNAIVGFHDLEKTPGKGSGSSSSGDDDEVIPDPDSPCDLTKDFGAPVTLEGPINSNNNGYSGSATLSPDELTIYFQRSTPPTGPDAGASGRLLKATRKKRTDQFGEPTELAELAPSGNEAVPALRADGLALFYAVEIPVPDIPNANRYQLSFATRATPTGPFEKPSRFKATDSAFSYDTNPFPSADGTEVYFASLRNGESKGLRLFRSSKPAGKTDFGEPEELVELRSDSEEFHAILTNDGLTMYFASDRTPLPKNGGQIDTYVAKRKDKTSRFENIEPLDSINSPAIDAPSWISKDSCRLYLERQIFEGDPREASAPPFGVIMMAERPPRPN